MPSVLLILVTLAIFVSPPAIAQSMYPSKPIRIVIGFGGGSAADIVGRNLTIKLQEIWTSGLIIDSKVGAAGLIATQEVARAVPDGYTLLLAVQSQISLPPSTNRNFPPDLLKELAPVAEVAKADLSFVVSPQHAAAKSIAEFLAWAKQRKVTFIGDFGAGSVTDLTGAYFAHLYGLPYEPVHYKSQADSAPALFAGDIQAMVYSTGTISSAVKSGRMRVLATTGAARSDIFPDAPTFKGLGTTDLEVVVWYGVMAPAKTPPDLLDKISAAFVSAAQAPAVRAKLAEIGFSGSGTGRAEFGRMIQEDTARWARVVAAIGFKAID